MSDGLPVGTPPRPDKVWLRARIAELERALAQQRDAEEALRQQRIRLRTVVSNAPIVLFALDAQGRFTLYEGKGLAAIGVKPGQFVGQSVFEAYGDEPDIVRNITRALAGESFTGTVHLRRIDVHFETRYTPLFDAAGNPDGCIGVATDVTEQHHVMTQLRESEERFRMLAENIPGVIYLCRNDSRYSMIYLNDAVQELTGYPKETFLSDKLSFVELFHPSDAPQISSQVNAALARHRPFRLRYRLEHRSGRWLWVEEYGAGVFHGDELMYLEGFLMDITARVEAEQALRRARDELERRVAERTANLGAANQQLERALAEQALTDQRLRRQQQTLAQVLRVATVGEMASGIAHELNQPLSAIVNYARGCARRAENGALDQRELLDAIARIADQAERAGEILRAIRRYIARQDAARHPIDLNQLVRESLELLDPDLRRFDVAVHLDLEPTLHAVEADRIMIQQVLVNLVRNGLEAMIDTPPTRRRLDLRTFNDSADGERFAAVEIIDSGPGLRPDSAARLFEPLFTTKPGGLGMGLSISRTIMEEHAGTIQGANHASGGARFLLRLPATPEA